MGKVANGDVVTYVKGTSNTGYIYPTTVVEGVLSGKNTTNATLTVAGKKLSVANGVTSATVIGDYDIKTTAQKFALDQYGYVVALAPDAVVENIPTQFAYVYEIQTQKASTGTMLGGATEAVAKARVAFTDGTVKVIDLNLYTKTDNKTYYVAPAAAGTVAETEVANSGESATAIGNWFGYTVNEDGSYTLAEISDKNAKVVNSVDVKANKSGVIGGKVTNSATSYLAINTAANKYAVTEATGLYGANITVTATKSLITYAKESKVISNVYMVDTAIGAVTAPALNYALAVAKGDTVASNNTEWTFFLNGKEVTYVIAAASSVEENKAYTLTEGANGVYTATAVDGLDKVVSANAKKVTVADDTFYITDGSAVYYTATTQIFNVTTGHTGEADTLEVGDYIVARVDSDSNALVVYIVDAPAP